MATMTEKWLKFGFEKGSKIGFDEGLLEGLELAVISRFGEDIEPERIMEFVKKIRNTDRLKNIRKDIMNSVTASELAERLLDYMD